MKAVHAKGGCNATELLYKWNKDFHNVHYGVQYYFDLSSKGCSALLLRSVFHNFRYVSELIY